MAPGQLVLMHSVPSPTPALMEGEQGVCIDCQRWWRCMQCGSVCGQAAGAQALAAAARLGSRAHPAPRAPSRRTGRAARQRTAARLRNDRGKAEQGAAACYGQEETSRRGGAAPLRRQHAPVTAAARQHSTVQHDIAQRSTSATQHELRHPPDPGFSVQAEGRLTIMWPARTGTGQHS